MIIGCALPNRCVNLVFLGVDDPSPLAFSTFGCFQTFLGGEACWKSEPTCARLRCAATLKRSDTINSFALILRGYERLHIEHEGATLDRKLEAYGMNMSYLDLN